MVHCFEDAGWAQESQRCWHPLLQRNLRILMCRNGLGGSHPRWHRSGRFVAIIVKTFGRIKSWHGPDEERRRKKVGCLPHSDLILHVELDVVSAHFRQRETRVLGLLIKFHTNSCSGTHRRFHVTWSCRLRRSATNLLRLVRIRNQRLVSSI